MHIYHANSAFLNLIGGKLDGLGKDFLSLDRRIFKCLLFDIDLILEMLLQDLEFQKVSTDSNETLHRLAWHRIQSETEATLIILDFFCNP